MKTPVLLAAMFSLFAMSSLVGCGVQPTAVSGLQAEPGVLRSQSHPGWGKKTWATLTVPAPVLGYALDEAAGLRKRFEKEYGNRDGFRLRLSLSLVASRDGFRTRVSAMNDQAATLSKPQALSFDLSGPAGEYQYYLVVTANVVEYDRAGSFRQIWKTYEPAHISDYGKNFRAVAD